MLVVCSVTVVSGVVLEVDVVVACEVVEVVELELDVDEDVLVETGIDSDEVVSSSSPPQPAAVRASWSVLPGHLRRRLRGGQSGSAAGTVGRLAFLVGESARGGTVVTAAVEVLAEDLRGRIEDELEARARRAAVLVVLPLGLCFLPAFLLATVVPLAVGLLTSAHVALQ